MTEATTGRPVDLAPAFAKTSATAASRVAPSRIWAGLAMALFVVAALAALTHALRPQHDSGIYVTLATSLATGHGYHDLWLTGDPVHTKYPPVFPLMLAAVLAVAGTSIVLLKLAVVATSAAALFVLHRLFAELYGEPVALYAVLLTASLHSMLFFAHSVMTEMPYLLLSLLTLLAARRCAHSPSPGWLWLTAALISVTYLTRLVGLALIPAVMVYVVVDGSGTARARWRRALLLGLLASCAAAVWFARSAVVSGGSVSPYAAEFRLGELTAPGTLAGSLAELAARVGANLLQYGIHLGRAILHWAPPVTIAMLLAAAVSLVGFLRCAVRRRTIVEYYVVSYLAILIVYPVNHPQRYLVPVLPFMLFYFVTGASWMVARLLAGVWTPARLRHGWGAAAAGVITAVLVVTNGAGAIARDVIWPDGERYHLSPGEHAYRDAALWARDHTPDGSVFLWAKASLRYVESGRKMVALSPRRMRGDLLPVLLAHKVDYVVLDTFSALSARTVGQVVARHPAHFQLVHTTAASRVYRVIHEPPAEPAARQEPTPR